MRCTTKDRTQAVFTFTVYIQKIAGMFIHMPTVHTLHDAVHTFHQCCPSMDAFEESAHVWLHEWADDVFLGAYSSYTASVTR